MNQLIRIFIFFSTMQLIEAQSFATGLVFDDAAYAKTPVKKWSRNLVPSKASLKPYCPTPQQQGANQNCVGWSIGYAACTISEAVAKKIDDRKLLDAMATSPSYVYTHGKSEKDIACKSGAVIDNALQKLKGVVIPRFQTFGEVCMPLERLPKNFTEGVRITEFAKLFQASDDWKQRLQQVKSALANRKPVIVGIACYKSLKNLKQGETVWSGDLDDYQGGHAVCLTGYDDDFEGGAVEMMNSWGANWGNKGFAMIRYQDLEGILKYAYEIKTDLSVPVATTTPKKQMEEVPLTLASSVELKLSANNSTIALQPLSRGFIPVRDDTTKTTTVTNTIPANYKTVQ
jgi:Papain family cysteine protease